MSGQANATNQAISRAYNTGVSSAVHGCYALPQCVVTAVELLTYFPYHVQWPELMFRLYRAGFRAPVMARAQLYARGTLTKDDLKRRHDAIRHQILTAGKEKFGTDFKGPTQAPYDDHPDLQAITATTYPTTTYPNGPLEHYDVSDAQPPRGEQIKNFPATLEQVGQGVVNHPRGPDAGIVTKCILFAQAKNWVDNNGHHYTVADIPSMAKRLGFTLPQDSKGHTWDQDGLVVCEHIAKPIL